MVKIRMTRMGAHKAPFYRIVDGQNIEVLGYYNPLTNPAEFKVDAEAAKKWLANGAQASATVQKLFKNHGIID